MINLFIWNIRGLANIPSQRRLKKLLKANNVECFAILEPKITKNTIKDFEFKLGCSGSCTNNEGNIWVFWRNNAKVTIKQCTAQYILIALEIGGIATYIHFIHANS